MAETDNIVVIPAHTLFGIYPPKIPEDEIKPMPDTGENTSVQKAPRKNVSVSVSSGYDKDFGYIDLYDYHVLTAAKEHVSDIADSVTLMTGEGEQQYERSDIFVLSSETAGAFTGEASVPAEEETETPEENHVTETLDKSTESVLYKVAYADNPNNFIFVGKGWGHGVGISQYGSYDLASRGYTFRQILETYFDGIALAGYRTVDS